LSGLEKKETELKCLENGIVKHFVKPFNPVDLMTAVSDLVKSRQLDKDLSAMAS
jgi:hypothetical protein